MNAKIKVGITMGDPSGIGPSIIAKALSKVKNLAQFVVIGDRKVFNRAAKQGDVSVKRGTHLSFFLKNPDASPCFEKSPVFIDLHNVDQKSFQFGKVRAEYGRAAIGYLDEAIELLKRKEIDCLVTAPISKEAINLAGFNYSGHTEYLEKATGAEHTVMMLMNKQLKFSLATRHIRLKSVSSKINKEMLSRTISMTEKALRSYFHHACPRIVVCGLNPHASDNGVIGDEENRLIKPVVQRLKRRIKYIDGPLPADVAIKKAYKRKYDCIIAMYHDQALIPLKLLGDESGVNLTLGLPFVRTSPLHGTAFDIAGTNLACPDSLIEAIREAIRCSLNQKKA